MLGSGRVSILMSNESNEISFQKKTYTYIRMAWPTSILRTLPETNCARQAPKDISSETTNVNFYGLCWFQMVSGNFYEIFKFWGPKMINWIELTAGRSYLLPTRFFFHTLFSGRRFGFLSCSVASSCPVAANQHGPVLLKIVEQVFKNTCLRWWCINIISEKIMPNDYCNSKYSDTSRGNLGSFEACGAKKFAGQKKIWRNWLFLHVCLKMRDWNWDNPSCIHHPWIGIIRCSMIFLYPLVESGCRTDRKKYWKKSGRKRQQGTPVITCTKHNWKIHPHDIETK